MKSSSSNTSCVITWQTVRIQQLLIVADEWARHDDALHSPRHDDALHPPISSGWWKETQSAVFSQ